MNLRRVRLVLASTAIVATSALALACLGEDVGSATDTPTDAGGAAEASPGQPGEDAGGDAARAEADAETSVVDAGPDVGPPATGTVTSVVRLGSPGYEESGPVGVAFDADGNLFVLGTLAGTMAFAGCNLTNVAKSDVFVARFDASGACTKAVVISSEDDDQGAAVAVDPVSKDVVVTGSSKGVTLQVLGAQVTGRGGSFIMKLSNDLVTTRWSTRFGSLAGAGTSGPRALSISTAGKIAVGGDFAGTPNAATATYFDPSNATFTSTPVGPYIPYIFQLTSAGQIDQGSRVFEPKAGSSCAAVTITSVAYDANRDLYFALSNFGGSVASPCEIYESVPLFNGATPRFTLTAAGVVLGRYQTSANGQWQNVTYTVPSANRGYVAVDPAGRVVVAYRYGNPQSQQLGTLVPVIPPTQGDDVLVVSYEENKVLGTFGPKAYVLGGSPQGDQPSDVATDPWGNVLVGGYGYGGFQVGGAAVVGYADAGVSPAGFVFKCRPGLGSCAWARMTGGANEAVNRVVVDGKGRTAAHGFFNPPGMTLGAVTLDTAGQLDGFLGILSP